MEAPLLIDTITIPETVFVKRRVAHSAAELSSFLLLCPGPARNQNWCSYPGLCWTDTSIFLIFLPNKFIFKQVQIHGLNYRVDTSSVFSVGIFTAKTFCRIRQSSKGDRVSLLFGPHDNYGLWIYLLEHNISLFGWFSNSIQQTLIRYKVHPKCSWEIHLFNKYLLEGIGR